MMTIRPGAFWAVFCALALIFGGVRAQAAEIKYHAVMIANSDYTHWENLRTPKNDVGILAQLLRTRYGFNIPQRNILTNGSRDAMHRHIERVTARLRENDRLLIYYAGHGALRGDRGYWVGTDGDRDLTSGWLSDLTISALIKDSQAGHIMVISDSCYAAAIFRGPVIAAALSGNLERSVVLSRLNTYRARTALTSGSVKPVLDGGGGSKHSVFADVLLTQLRQNEAILEASELARRLQAPVAGRARAAGIEQIPRYEPIHAAEHDGGDFLFIPIGQSLPGLSPQTSSNVDLALRGGSQNASATGSSCEKAIDCFRIGKSHYHSKDYARAREPFRLACERGEPRGCTDLGWLYKEGLGVSRDYKLARHYYERGCDGGNAVGCGNLGVLYRDALGVSRDYDKAHKLFRQGCDGGDGHGCTNLGWLYRNGLGVPQDGERARIFYKRGCDSGDTLGCSNLGWLYKEGLDVSRDYERARVLFQKGCQGGGTSGCNNLGVLYRDGLGVSEDNAHARTLFLKACGGGNANGCTNLGVLHRDGLGGAQDYDRARTLYEKGCDGGDANGCTNLGYLYRKGLGLAADYERARIYYQKGCDGGHALGCVNLGALYEEGRGVTADTDRAIVLYKQGCEGGNGLGCRYLGENYETGRGVSKDQTQSKTYFRKGCDLNDKESCAKL